MKKHVAQYPVFSIVFHAVHLVDDEPTARGDAFNFDPRVLGIQPCHPSGSKPAAHFFRTEVRIRDLQVAMTSRYHLYQYQFFVNPCPFTSTRS